MVRDMQTYSVVQRIQTTGSMPTSGSPTAQMELERVELGSEANIRRGDEEEKTKEEREWGTSIGKWHMETELTPA